MKSSEKRLVNVRMLILVGGVGVLLNCCAHVERGTESPKAAGDAAFRKGDYATAKAQYEKALQATLSGGGDVKAGTDLTSLYFALGDTCRRMGKGDEAVGYHKKEVEEAAKSAAPEDQIASLDAIYGIQYKAGKYAEAEEAARAELAAVDKYLKPDDPRVELALSNVIAVACRSGVCKDETELFTRLYDRRVARYGATATSTCAARQMLAESYSHKNKYAKAAELYKANLDAYTKTAPNMVPEVSGVYARALLKAGRPAEALAAVAAVKDASGGGAVKLWALRGDAYDALGRRADALAAYAQMAKIGEETWGARDEQLANYLVRYSEQLKKAERKAEAAALDKRIANIYKEGKK